MKRAVGLVLLLAWPLAAPAQDRSKKAYELMYEDVQQLKQQSARIEKRLDQAADDLRLLRDQVRDLTAQFRGFQTEQARSQDSLRNVPPQIQAIQEILTQIENQLLRLAADVQAARSRPENPAEAGPPTGQDPGAKAPAEKKPGEPAAKEPDKKTPTVPPPPATLNANELYQTATADYAKGNYDLALDGFKIYREQNPTSPLADDALYYAGECLSNQKKFAPAVEAYDELIVTSPASNRIAAAYLKKGYALAELKKKDEAVAVLKLLVSKFPLEEEAKHAQEKIKELMGKQ